MNDILEIHYRITNFFREKHKKLEMVTEMKEKLQHVLNSKISPRLKRIIESDINSINLTITCIDNLEFYFIETADVLKRYIDIINTPINNSFFDKSVENINVSNKNNLINEYYLILTNYRKFLKQCNIPFLDNGITDCEHCKNNFGFIYNENIAICYYCNVEKSIMKNKNITNEFKITHKYSYDRNVQFRDCIIRFQAKQNISIPLEIFQNVRQVINKYRIVNVELSHVYLTLKNLGYTKYYEHFVLIHSLITGIPAPNIEHLEEQIITEFELILIQLNEIKDLNLKNFNTQYVMFQLLKLHNFKFHPDHLLLVKSTERKLFTNKVCKVIFQNLGWKFTEI